MHKTAALTVFAIVASLGIAGAVVILRERPDAIAQLTGFVLTVLALLSTYAGNLYVNNKTQTKLDRVEKQTNGTNTQLRNENRALQAEIVRLNRLRTPETFDTTTGETIYPVQRNIGINNG